MRSRIDPLPLADVLSVTAEAAAEAEEAEEAEEAVALDACGWWMMLAFSRLEGAVAPVKVQLHSTKSLQHGPGACE